MHKFLTICLIATMSLLPALVMAADTSVTCCHDGEIASAIDSKDSCCCEPGSCIDMTQSCQCDAPQLNPFRPTTINPDLLNARFKRLYSNTAELTRSPFLNGLYRPPIIL